MFLPIGAEDKFTGLIDVVNQKASLIWRRRCANEGLNYEVTEIPGRTSRRAKRRSRN